MIGNRRQSPAYPVIKWETLSPDFHQVDIITHPLHGYHVRGYLMRYHSQDSQEVQRVELSIKDCERAEASGLKGGL